MTNPPPRAPLRVHPAAAITVIVVCALVPLGLFWPIASLLGQAYLLAALLLAFRYWPPMARWVARMPVPHRLVFILLIGGMILGHFTLNTRRYYPFVAWAIFPVVREEDPVACRQMIGTTAGNKSVRLLAEQLVPSIIQFNLPDDPASTERLVRTLAKIYNRDHPDDPVRRVDLMVMAVHLHPSSTESHIQPSCELLRRYAISSDR